MAVRRRPRREFENGERNPLLEPGDIITVSEAKYVYLQGEVAAPGRVRVERELTLLKAIAQSGGLTDWANRRKIRVLTGEQGELRTFDLKEIQNGKLADPQLLGGEVVVVPRRVV